jgi:hypothetical protein
VEKESHCGFLAKNPSGWVSTLNLNDDDQNLVAASPSSFYCVLAKARLSSIGPKRRAKMETDLRNHWLFMSIGMLIFPI